MYFAFCPGLLWVRCLLYDVLDHMHKSFPAAAPEAYQDDLTQIVQGPTHSWVESLAALSGKTTINKLKAIGCRFAGESAVIAYVLLLSTNMYKTKVKVQDKKCNETHRFRPSLVWHVNAARRNIKEESLFPRERKDLATVMLG